MPTWRIRSAGETFGAEFRTLQVGDAATIEYLGVSYQVRITTRYDDYGNAVSRYDLEVTGTT